MQRILLSAPRPLIRVVHAQVHVPRPANANRHLTTDTMQVLIAKYKQKLQALTPASVFTNAATASPGGKEKNDSSDSNNTARRSATAASTTTTPGGKKTMAELDEELRLKMEEGMTEVEGGPAGVEYEDGKAEGLKRGVKANMFRVI